MNADKTIVACLIFPTAPIVTIYFIFFLCLDIWQESYFRPGDGGEAEPGIALTMIPILLIIAALLLGGLTVLTRWVASRYTPGPWWCWVMAVPRVAVVAGSTGLYLVAAAFFMGDTLGVFRHWQVAIAWVICAMVLVPFFRQQYARIRGDG